MRVETSDCVTKNFRKLVFEKRLFSRVSMRLWEMRLKE